MAAKTRGKPRPKIRFFRTTPIRVHRLKAKMSLHKLAAMVGEATGEGFTHASLSRIERGLQPYSQPVIEAIADVLTKGDVGALLRDPNDPGNQNHEKIAEIARIIAGRSGSEE